MQEKFAEGTHLKVLYLENSEKDAEIIRKLILDSGYELEMQCVMTENEFTSSLRNNQYDIILSDFGLPGFNALGALEIKKQIAPETPFICVSGSVGEETAIELLKLGAVDYVLKDRPERLPFSIKRALEESEEIKARKESEAALEASEEKYKLLFDANPSSMWVYDLRTLNFLEVNDAALQKYGYSKEEFLRMNLKDIRPEEEHKKLLHDVKKETDTLSFSGEWKHKNKAGEIFLVEIISHAVLYKGRRARLVLANDITKRKEAEIEVHKSKAELEEYFENAISADYVANLEGEIFSCNKTFLELFGLTAKDQIHKFNIVDFYKNPEDRKQLIQKVKTNRKIENYEVDFCSVNGEIINTIINAIGNFDENDNLIKIRGYIVDITERRNAEKQLIKSEAKYRNFFENDLTGDYETLPDGTILLCNEAFAKILKYESKDELINNYADKLYPTVESRNAFLSILKREKFLKNNEITLKAKDVSEVVVVENVVGYFDEKDELIRIIGYMFDITNRKNAEKALRESLEKFRLVWEKSTEGMRITSEDGIIIMVNDAYCKLVQKSHDELEGKPMSIIQPERSRKEILQKHQERFRSRNVHKYLEKKITLWNGDDVYLELSNTFLEVENQPTLLLTIFRDITERKRMEGELRKSEAELKEAQRVGRLGSWDWDATTDTITWSEEYYRIYGFDPKLSPPGYEEHLNIYTPESSALLDEAVKRSMQTGEEYQLDLELARADGTTRWVTAHGEIKHNDKGQIVGLRGTAQDITERKRAEEELKKKNTFIQTVLDNLPIGIALNEIDKGNAFYANKKFEEIYGWSIEEMKDISGFFEKVYPDKKYREELITKINADIQSGDPTRMHWEDCIVIHKDGSKHVVNAVNIPLSKQNTMVSTVMDITELKHAEEEVAMLAHSLRSINECVGITDMEDKILFVNESFLKTYGYDESELIGKHVGIVRSLNNPPELVKEILPTTLLGGWQGELWNKRKDGSEFQISLSTTIIRDKSGKAIALIGVATDITERKHSEEELRKLSLSVEQSPALVIITDSMGDIEYVNSKFCEVTGYTKDEVKGKNPRILKSGHHNKQFYEELWNTILSGREWKGEFLEKKKNGELYWESARISPMVNKEGDITNFVAVKEDITEKKKMIEDLIIAKEKAEESDKLKSEFLAQMSHEIRTPLNVISGNTSLLKDVFCKSTDYEARESFISIETALKRIIRTVDLILNTADLKTGVYKTQLVYLDLNSKILNKFYHEYQLIAQQNGLEFIYVCEVDDSKILADDYSIDQIFANLIDNAINYTKKGKVEMFLRKNETGNIIVEIKDTGIGISKEFLPKLFEPFTQEEQGYSRSFEGNGLGLALVKNYCDINKAIIEVETKKNVGSTFRVIFA